MKFQIFLNEDMPELSIGEFGISVDTAQIFIGTENGVQEIGKTLISESTINGNIIVDGEEITVYDDNNLIEQMEALQEDLSEKADKTALSAMEENLLNEIDNVKSNDYSVRKLSELEDVEIENVKNDDQLVYESTSEKWKAKKRSGEIIGDNGFVFEDFEDQEVIIIGGTPPEDITNLTVSNVETTSFTINWEESISEDTQSYIIYLNDSLLTTVKATNSKLIPLSYTINDLSPSTSYNITIITEAKSGNKSNGVTAAFSTSGNKAIHLNGVSDYIQLPLLTFDRIDLVYEIDRVKPDANFLDARNGAAARYVGIDSHGKVGTGYFGEVLVDKSSNDLSIALHGKRTITATEPSPITDDVTIFAYYIPSRQDAYMPGKVFSIKLFKQNSLIAHYDFTNEFSGSSIEDLSGNNTATLHGGVWVNE